MPRKPTRALVLLSVLLPAAAAGQVSVDPPRIDFGERGQNERPEATITLRNTGNRPLVVEEIKKSCDCLTIVPPSLQAPIPPAGSFPLKVTMSSGRAMGRLDKQITVSIKSSLRARAQVSIPVSMRVLEEYDMEPRSIRLEGVHGGQPERAALEVKLRRGITPRPLALEVKKIHASFGRPSAEFLRASVTPTPGGQKLEVEIDPKHPEGPISAEVEASLDGKALFIPINGEMFAWIKVSPNYVNFSRASDDDPASTRREVVLTSTDGTAFRVLEVQSRPYRPGEKTVKLEFSVEPGSAPPAAPPKESPPAGAPAVGAAATVQKVICRAIRGEPAAEASFFGTVVIRTDHPRKPEITLKYSGFFAPPPAQKPPGAKKN